MRHRDRLDQEINNAVFNSLDRIFQGGITGHDNHRHGIILQSDVFSQIEAIHFRHVYIGETAVHTCIFKDFQCFDSVASSQRLVPLSPKKFTGNV